MSEKLLPCPFCGNILFDTFFWAGKERIQCPNSVCPIHGLQMDVDKWNHRTPRKIVYPDKKLKYKGFALDEHEEGFNAAIDEFRRLNGEERA